MAKSYPEQLGEWVKQRESTQRDKNLVAFVAVRGDVKAALEAGYAVKTVWANMTETKRIEFSYDTFLNYVNRTLRRPQIDQTTTLTVPESPAILDSSSAKPKAGAKKSAAETSKPEAPAGFTFNPVPNKEELL